MLDTCLRAGHGSLAILQRIVIAVRKRWPGVTIEIRADSGFALPNIYGWCEAERITYTIGRGTNARLDRAVAALQAEAEHQSAAQDGAKVRLLGETMYQADSWPHPRRVVMKAEVLAKGTEHPLRRHHPHRGAGDGV